MRIDAHHHFWKYSSDDYGWIADEMAILKHDFLPGDFKPLLDRTGVEGTVAVQARQSVQETEWLLELADANPWIRGVVGWLDLQAPDVRDQLERYARHPRLKGIRHVVQDEPDDRFMLRPAFLHGLSQLNDFDLAYDLLLFPRHLPIAVEVVQQFPQQRFVLDHIAKPDIKAGAIFSWERDLRDLARFPHVYCKVSGMVTEADWRQWKLDDFRRYLDVVFDGFGPDRIMWGSDWPVCTLAAQYAEVLLIILDYVQQLPIEQQENVFGRTAERFYRLT